MPKFELSWRAKPVLATRPHIAAPLIVSSAGRQLTPTCRLAYKSPLFILKGCQPLAGG